MILTMNNHLRSFCDMCGETINDRYYLLVGTRKLHNECLTCQKCSVSLSADTSCYEKDEKMFCKSCYFRLFSVTKCIGCNIGLSSTDLVMQANDSYYHVNCFRCSTCAHLLQKGEKFGVRSLKLYCEEHYFDSACRKRPHIQISNENITLSDNHHPYVSHNTDDKCGNKYYHHESAKRCRNISLHSAKDNITGNIELKSSISLINDLDNMSEQLKLPHITSPYPSHDNSPHGFQFNDLQTEKELTSLNPISSTLVLDSLPQIPSICTSPTLSEMTKSLTSSGSSDEDAQTPVENVVGKSKRGKPKRVRTTFKHYQLIAMKELFDLDKNPDSKALTELSEKVDLTKRVLQVWFQNARAKQRKGQSIFSESVEKLLSPAEEKNRIKGEGDVKEEPVFDNSDNTLGNNPSNNNSNINVGCTTPPIEEEDTFPNKTTCLSYTDTLMVFSNS